MKTIAIVAEKGGVGKTTLATHLAVHAQSEGRRTVIIDLDPQASARKWGVRRNAEPEVVSDHAEMLQELLRTAEEGGADLVIIAQPQVLTSPLCLPPRRRTSSCSRVASGPLISKRLWERMRSPRSRKGRCSWFSTRSSPGVISRSERLSMV
jgi:hypothetical protein